MTDHSQLTYALIDPVGAKAGMDHYDIALARGMSANGVEGIILSNFLSKPEASNCKAIFHNTGKRGWRSATSTVNGFLKALKLANSKKAEWVIVHLFTAGFADAFLLTLVRLMGFRICGIVHDIESLDEFSPGSIRKVVIRKLLDKRIVHNRFSFDELQRLDIINIGDPDTHIIPHIHFIHLFEGKNDTLTDRKNDDHALKALHPALDKAVINGKPILLFFGQIKKPKGLDILLNAFAEIKNEAVLVIAGKTRDEPWQRYTDIIRKLGLEDSVVPVIRHITDTERDLLFSVSRAVILPYTRIYQSGVLLMSMSYPLAVVASDLQPNLDTLQDGVNGLLFRTGDASDLSRQLKRIIHDDPLARQCSSNALETMRMKHDPVTIGRSFADVLTGATSTPNIH